jgi:hypothetical protein
VSAPRDGLGYLIALAAVLCIGYGLFLGYMVTQ